MAPFISMPIFRGISEDSLEFCARLLDATGVGTTPGVDFDRRRGTFGDPALLCRTRTRYRRGDAAAEGVAAVSRFCPVFEANRTKMFHVKRELCANVERFPRGQYYGSTLGVDAYSFEGTIAVGDRIYDETITMAKQVGPIDKAKLLGTTGDEQALEIVDSFFYDKRRWYSANVPNDGIVSNLPKDADPGGAGGRHAGGHGRAPLGEIPVPIASVLLRRLGAVEATVDAALTGNRRTMAEALILDGGVSDYATAVKLTDALIRAQAEHLPQFA